MTIVAAVALLLGMLMIPPQVSFAIQSNDDAQRTTIAPSPDDSLQSVKKAETLAPGKGATAPTAVDPCDPESRRASRNMFASWTRERVQGYNLHVLDSLELRGIGLVVADNGTIWRTQGSTAEGMQEANRRESTLWFIQGVFKATNPADSARLAEQFRKGEPYAKLHGINHPIQVSEDIKVEPVLVTNSRGYTFSHTCDISNPGGASAIGSGKYRGQELVAIRVPYKGPTLPADTAEYFYIYWYEPSEELLLLVPPRVREEISQRREERCTVAMNSAHPTGGLATSNLHPNPITQDVATIDYTLREACRVAVSVYDISGERVRDVIVSEQRDPGEWQENISLAGIPDGYYLLAITTDNGEQNIHPMVLKR